MAVDTTNGNTWATARARDLPKQTRSPRRGPTITLFESLQPGDALHREYADAGAARVAWNSITQSLARVARRPDPPAYVNSIRVHQRGRSIWITRSKEEPTHAPD